MNGCGWRDIATDEPTGTRAARTLGLVLLALLLGAARMPDAGAAEPADEQQSAAPGSISFVGRNALLKADGHFRRWRFRQVQIDREHPESGVVEVEVEITSLDTGIGRRDKHLRSDDFFSVEQFPSALIRIHDAYAMGESESGNPRYGAKFDITIRDVTKTLEGDFEVLSTTPTRVRGSLVLNRVDFGIGKPHSRWNPMSIREEIPVSFSALLP